MCNTIKVGLFICASILLSQQPAVAVSATEPHTMDITDDPLTYLAFAAEVEDEPKTPESERNEVKKESDKDQEKPDPAPQPTVHTVAAGESLSIIARAHATEWRRLFDKNTDVADPNVLSVGQQIVIPFPDEEVAVRPLPAPAPTVQLTSESRDQNTSATTSSVSPRSYASSAGNRYSPGYCTWYAKNRRPDLPNQMGNASSWVGSAAARGFATGSTPRAGAIGQQGNHVVYVESVNGDGTVTVSEMNWRGLYVVSSRTVAAGNFRYIY